MRVVALAAVCVLAGWSPLAAQSTQTRTISGTGSNASWFTNDSNPCAAADDPVGANDGGTTVDAPNGVNGLMSCAFTAFAITAVAASMDLKMHGWCLRGSTGTGVQLAILVNGTFYYSPTQTIPAGASYSDVTYTWTTNPNTTAEWTESHIESGSGGLTEIGARGDGVDADILCTSFYPEVLYTAPSTTNGSLGLLGAGK